jgi:Tol biopolymer transport system component
MRDAPADWSPAWSPDGKYLYFASDRQGSMNLWRAPIDEASGRVLGDLEPITTPAQMVAHPSVSGDGTRIAFSSVLMTQNIQTAAFDPATATVKGEPTWVTTGSRQWSSPDFSPDGQWIVVASRAQPEGDLYVVRADGTGLRQVTSDAAVDRVPRWSTDGSWIATFSNRSGQIQVWKIRPDGSGLGQVTAGQDASIVAWSPDGDRMAASADEGDSKVYLLDPNRPWAQQTVETLPTPPEALRPFIANAWSSDSKKLVGQISFGAKGIVTYSLGTRTYDRFTDYGEYPVWLPDSRRVLFVARGKDFFVLDTRTREVGSVFTAARDVIGPPRLTRDGRRVCFSRRVTEADIWLVTLR